MAKVSIKVVITGDGGENAEAAQEFALPKNIKDDKLSPLANKMIRTAAAAAGVKIPKVTTG